jgi:hypothetical protein
MRPSWWTILFIAVLTCSVTDLQLNESLSPSRPDVAANSERHSADETSDRAPMINDQARPDGDSAAADLKRDQRHTAHAQARLAYYAYSEIPHETTPADTVLNFLKDVPPGTPVDEIQRVADVLGLDVTFMKAVAKVESNFDPKQRTGSYLGLFQLSNDEFRTYGAGNILAARDNAVAFALKFQTAAILFEMFTRKKATLNDLYLIHQQGLRGAAEHISQPNRLAWRSMCATDEGKQKGEKWCKRAIWRNTLPALKRVWKNVNNVTSGAFVGMWQQRVALFYSRYSDAAVIR